MLSSSLDMSSAESMAVLTLVKSGPVA